MKPLFMYDIYIIVVHSQNQHLDFSIREDYSCPNQHLKVCALGDVLKDENNPRVVFKICLICVVIL